MGLRAAPWLALACTLVATWLGSATAHAQALATEPSCAWPGLTHSAALGRCTGVPACPLGLVEHGESCVPPLEPALEPSEVDDVTARAALDRPGFSGDEAIEPSPLAPSWPSARTRWDRPRQQARLVRGEDEVLVTLALAVFDAGWILGWIGTGIGMASDPSSAWSGAVSTIPVIGAITYGFTSRSGLSAYGFGIPSIILQGLGVIGLGIALGNETSELRLGPIGEHASLGVVPAATGADAGLTLRLAF